MQATEEIDAAVRHLGRMMFDRDSAFADEFAEDGVLVGSEAGEIAHGRDAIRTLIAKFHALPDRYIWDWHTLEIRAERQCRLGVRRGRGGRHPAPPAARAAPTGSAACWNGRMAAGAGGSSTAPSRRCRTTP